MLALLDIALELPQLWPQTRELILAAAPLFELAGHRDDWCIFLERGLRHSQEQGDLNAEAEIYLRLGWLHQLRGRFDSAYESFSKSKVGYQQQQYGPGTAQALNRMAFIACLHGNYPDAMALSMQGLRLLDETDPDRAMHHNMLGRIAFQQRHWEDAIRDYRRALALRRRQGDRLNIARNLRDLGTALHHGGHIESAIACLSEAIERFADLPNRQQEAVVRMNLGNLYLQEGRPSDALEQYRSATYLLRQTGDMFHLAAIHSNVGYAYSALATWEAAEHAFLAAIDCRPEAEDEFWRLDALEGLSTVYANSERTDNAVAAISEALAFLSQFPTTPDVVQRRRKLLDLRQQLMLPADVK